jgi:hypothetical protein
MELAPNWNYFSGVARSVNDTLMLRISSETGGKLACRRDWLLHPLGCEARSADLPADDHPH